MLVRTSLALPEYSILLTYIRVIRVMCSARITPLFILKALSVGADGALVLGWRPGDCHYSEGNYKTLRRMALLKKILAQMGIEDERVSLDWVSATEGARFAAMVNDMTEKVRALGPFKKNSQEERHGQS
jgi:F420-non-reducing hydrogenase iron-sulfur subunit